MRYLKAVLCHLKDFTKGHRSRVFKNLEFGIKKSEMTSVNKI